VVGEGGATLAFDVSDPVAPQLVAAYAPTSSDYRPLNDGEAVAADDSIVLADGELTVLDFSERPVARTLATYAFPDGISHARGVAVEGRYAYVAAGPGGVHVFDVSEPPAVVPIARLDTAGSARRIAVRDGTAFVADEDGGLVILQMVRLERRLYLPHAVQR
jgi:hypothetical protein